MRSASAMNTLHAFFIEFNTYRNQIINEKCRQQSILKRSILKHLSSYSKDARNIPSEPRQRLRGLLSVLSGIQLRFGVINRRLSECLLKRFMCDGFFAQTSHDFLYNKQGHPTRIQFKSTRHSIVKRILLFKWQIQAYFYPLKILHLFGFPS